MNNLQLNNKNTITTLEIADMLEIRHWEVLRKLEGTEKTKGIIDILNDNNFVVVDYFIKSTYLDSKNESRPCYNVTKLGCDFLANKFTGEKGIIFTAKYVRRFNEMERVLKEQQPKLPTTYKEALQQLLIEVEEKEQLQLENQEKDKVIQLQQPKVLFADAVSTSNNSILVGELAKLIKQNGVDIGQNRLFAWMRENGYLIKRKGEDYNIPTQKSMNLRIMEVKKRVINNPDGSTKVTRTVKITGKGQVYFVNKFKSSKQLSMLS
ncbi:phage antirepressor KilAC domain-containing protein [Clostridioides difficile]|uniref:phage antirepressor KilAC domain-containing protein n=1 Tax=Clostridioides difficile TaxID=1496 RepID=UPI001033A86D|nr:phage antirepressor KilAC domain-containing protein [Clostridioides difficile]MBY1307851.1 phage regulatory protein/antirepressor Ant [Clostridioides difficile]MCB4239268.1 phage regulatory protein/antirepressor Ant [Clostridioides difficile]HBF2451308.1 phage antirepressor KilAC domain-containing protein [Clostridioides difficile]HBF5975655.1 phage antirepressor KilAC domain-containing protein [Clostridioides difficile]HBG2553813.1 phage antirepressor KilAC domain-containing protein [Clost